MIIELSIQHLLSIVLLIDPCASTVCVYLVEYVLDRYLHQYACPLQVQRNAWFCGNKHMYW
jgi:hypothetical protein